MFFITCVQQLTVDDKGWLDTGAQRTVGYYDNLDDTVSAILENCCDIQEYIFHYAILEEIPAGVYPSCNLRKVFEFDDNTRIFHEIAEPACMKHIASFSIG